LPDSQSMWSSWSLTFVAEDTLPPLKERRRQQAQLASRPSTNLAVLGTERDDLPFRTEGSIRVLFSAELRPIHLSQSLTFVAQNILPPLKERRRQQAQVASRQTKSYRPWVRTRRFDVQNRRIHETFIYLPWLRSILSQSRCLGRLSCS